MFGKTVYILGSMGLAVLAYKFVAWQLVFQLMLIAGLSLWVLVGGLLVGNMHKLRAREVKRTQADNLDARAATARAAYVAQFGEQPAAQIDRDDPRFWKRVASQPMVTK